MTITYILHFLGVMGAMIIADICWAYYFIKVDERRPISAASWGTLIYACSGFTVVSYTTNRTYMIAAMLGSFIGTAGIVEYKRRKELKKKK